MSAISKIKVGGTTYDIANPYAVGSIYTSDNNTSPASLFGGSWEQIENLYSDPDYSKSGVFNAHDEENPTISITQDCMAVIWARNSGADTQQLALLVNGKEITRAYSPGININGTWYVYFGLNVALPLKKGDVITVKGDMNQRVQATVVEVPYKTTNYRWKRVS